MNASFKNKICLLGAAAAVSLASCALPFSAMAADPQSSAPAPQAVVLADVNIRDAKATVNGKSVQVQFTISNDGQEAQPDVKYGVELFKTESGSSVGKVDSFIADETLSLSPQQLLQKSLMYTPPPFFAGTYQVWVVARNSNGMPFSEVPAGDITLTPTVTDSYIDFDPNLCNLRVVGTTDNQVYTLDQGIDILPTERLSVWCLATSHFAQPQTVQVKFRTYRRSQFGDLVQTDSPQQRQIMLQPGWQQPTQFLVPRPQVPQSYDAYMTFVDAAGNPISNTVLIHYVLHGPSGTIQNASLDKDEYYNGDVATVTVAFSGSADSFLGSRNGSSDSNSALHVDASISGQGGGQCAGPADRQVDANNEMTTSIPLSISSRCVDPTLAVALKDNNGNILDRKTFSVITGGSASSNADWTTVVIIAFGLIVVLIAAYFVPKLIRKLRPAPVDGNIQNV